MNKLLQEERIEACKLYFNQFHKIPRIKETMMFKGVEFKIGQFVQCAKKGYYNDDVRHELINIFGPNVLESGHYYLFSQQDKITACIFYFNQFGRIPRSNDEVLFSDGRIFKIGSFIKNLKNGLYPDLKPEIEKIFGEIKQIRNNVVIPMNTKLELCKQFYEQFNSMPRYSEIMCYQHNGEACEFKIGHFINYVKGDKCSKEVKRVINDIFNGTANYEIEIKPKDDQKLLDLIKEYKTLGIKTEKYKGVNVENVIHGIKSCGYHKTIRNELINFLDDLKIEKDTKIINIIQDYVKENAVFPSSDTIFQGVRIYYLINSILSGKCHKNLKPEVQYITRNLM